VFGTGLGASLKASGLSEATLSDEKKMAEAYKQADSFKNAMERVHQVASQSKYETGDSSEAKAMQQGIRASLDQSRNHTDQASASYQQSLTYKELASRARQNTGAWGAGMERPFVEWMKTQPDKYNGGNFEEKTVAWMAEHDPEAITPFVEQFIKERIEPKLAEGMGEMKTAEDVRALFDQGKAGIPSANDVSAQGRQWLGGVRGAAAQAGVDPQTGVDSPLPQQITAEQGRADKAIGVGKSQAETEGKPLEDKVPNQTDPGTQPLLGLAATNAVAQVLPDGVSRFMMEKLPGVDMNVGTRGAAVAEAAAERARMGQARDPVMQAMTRNMTVDRDHGAVMQAIAEKMTADNRDHDVGSPGVLSGALNRGERAVGDLFSGSLGGSGLGNLLGGGSRPVPVQQQPTEGSDGRQKGDTPPPSEG
jgi:conjugal transfer mating pair stabilization protein TraG